MTPSPATDHQGVVLIVDDVPDNLALLSSALEQAGYMVLVALDGRSALERMQRLKPEIVLLDAMMPGLDGFETCRLMKAEASFEDVPVVFMTALTESEHVLEGFAAGGRGLCDQADPPGTGGRSRRRAPEDRPQLARCAAGAAGERPAAR